MKKKVEVPPIDSKKEFINQELTQINEVESALLTKRESDTEISDSVSSSKKSDKDLIKDSKKDVTSSSKKPRKRSITVGSGLNNYVKLKRIFILLFDIKNLFALIIIFVKKRN